METKQPDDQAALWNGPAGRAWVEAQEVLDRMFQPFEALLGDAAAAAPGGRVLDVGCGTGATTLATARRLGGAGRCTGLDLSAPMLALAEARAGREGSTARFVRGDAQTYAFAPDSFDIVISRFGVMFFDDPVAAFANLRRAVRADGQLRAVAWRSPDENGFMTTAERAAAPLLPALPPRRPDAPGQFAFADRARVTRILEAAGWADVALRPIDVACALPERDLLAYAARLGPVGRFLEGADEATRAAVEAQMRAAFAPFVQGGEARFIAACWMVEARAPRG